MGGIFGCCGKEEEINRRFWIANLKERDHLEDIGVDGRITLN
jgi:hypothetical protein